MEKMPHDCRSSLEALIAGLGQEPGAELPAQDASYERGPVRGRAAPIEERKKLEDQQLSYEHLLEHLVLAQATDLARSGRYAEADKLLAENMRDLDRTPAALDLRARMYAQQGQLREARSCWNRALQLDPTNEATYIASLDRINGYSSYR